MFGWAALLGDAPTRIASAVAHEDSAVLRLSGPQTLQVLETDPASAYAVMRKLSALDHPVSRRARGRSSDEVGS